MPLSRNGGAKVQLSFDLQCFYVFLFVNSSVHGFMVTFLLLLYVRLLKAVSLTFVLHDEEQ